MKSLVSSYNDFGIFQFINNGVDSGSALYLNGLNKTLYHRVVTSFKTFDGLLEK